MLTSVKLTNQALTYIQKNPNIFNPMNGPQLAAIAAALTRKLTLIQGPPGSGVSVDIRLSLDLFASPLIASSFPSLENNRRIGDCIWFHPSMSNDFRQCQGSLLCVQQCRSRQFGRRVVAYWTQNRPSGKTVCRFGKSVGLHFGCGH